MRLKLRTSAALALVVGLMTVATAAPKYSERWTTDPDDRDLDRVSVSGKIESIRGQQATMRTEDGQRVTVHLGPQWYWHDKGYSIESGRPATVSGWGSVDDDGYLFAASISGPGYYFELCDSDGYPRWADRDDFDRGCYPTHRYCRDAWYCDRPHRDRYYCEPPRWTYRHCPPPPPPHHGHHRHRRGCR